MVGSAERARRRAALSVRAPSMMRMRGAGVSEFVGAEEEGRTEASFDRAEVRMYSVR